MHDKSQDRFPMPLDIAFCASCLMLICDAIRTFQASDASSFDFYIGVLPMAAVEDFGHIWCREGLWTGATIITITLNYLLQVVQMC